MHFGIQMSLLVWPKKCFVGFKLLFCKRLKKRPHSPKIHSYGRILNHSLGIRPGLKRNERPNVLNCLISWLWVKQLYSILQRSQQNSPAFTSNERESDSDEEVNKIFSNPSLDVICIIIILTSRASRLFREYLGRKLLDRRRWRRSPSTTHFCWHECKTSPDLV